MTWLTMLLELSAWEPSLTAVLAALTAISTVAAGVLGIRQRTWKALISNQESALHTALAELQIHEKAAARLSTENRGLLTENEHLKALTDLKPLTDIITNWVTEGRVRFEAASKRLDEIHAQQSVALTGLLEEVRAQRINADKSNEALVAALNQQMTAFATHTLEDRQYQLRTVSIMDSLERRMSDVAVRVGMVQWSEPDEKAATQTSSPNKIKTLSNQSGE